MTCRARENQLPCSLCHRVETLLHFHACECRLKLNECPVLHCKLIRSAAHERIKQEMNATRRGQKRSAEEEGGGTMKKTKKAATLNQ